jgi:glyoxylate reductase
MARKYIEKNYERPFFDKLLRNFLSITLPNVRYFKVASFFVKIGKPFSFLFPKKIKNMIGLMPTSFPKKLLKNQEIYRAKGKKIARVALLTGCVQKEISPQINESTIRLLNRHGVEVVVMKKILVTRKLLKDCEDKAIKTFEAKLNTNDELYSQSKLIELSQGCDAVLTSLTDKMDEETINKLPETVKVISNFAVGFGNIDLEAAKKRGIAVTNTPEVLSDATAEIGILLILGACRRAAEGIEAAKESNWKWSADYLIGKQLTGSRLGILGMGRIGQKIAKIAKSLGMIIHYHNRSKLSDDKEQGAIYHDSLKSLFSVSDVLSICCPATKETVNLINKETVEYFPKGAVITNVARGDIVDDDALIDALNRRKIYAAGLDVYKGEPNLNPGYLKIKTAFILPHLGSATKDTRTAMANLAIDNIDEFFNTGNCKNKVN